MALVAEVFIGALNVRMSILAMSLLMRPYTLTQTDQYTVKSSCKRGGPYVFVREAAPAQPIVQRTPANPHAVLVHQAPDHLVERDILSLLDHANDETFMGIQP